MLKALVGAFGALKCVFGMSDYQKACSQQITPFFPHYPAVGSIPPAGEKSQTLNKLNSRPSLTNVSRTQRKLLNSNPDLVFSTLSVF